MSKSKGFGSSASTQHPSKQSGLIWKPESSYGKQDYSNCVYRMECNRTSFAPRSVRWFQQKSIGSIVPQQQSTSPMPV
ncbi:hypothetical protein ACQ4M3_42335 [Leptolyngbya sp. AN03gr2]|uniref:hypothetical protein n=1 Tax=unclassified Leptolyngbya TaxID=2650499 RepID=UPI003D315A42